MYSIQAPQQALIDELRQALEEILHRLRVCVGNGLYRFQATASDEHP